MSGQTLTLEERKRGAIIGAAVADAASLGFHWLYDQDRIKRLAPNKPEFRTPAPADYADTTAYFAHAKKNAGDLSQYGEQHFTLLRALVDNDGLYSKDAYEKAFIECFGYGGSYTGYIDHPTRDTLNNIIIAQNEATTHALDLPFDGSDEFKRKLLTKVLGNAKQHSGDALKQKVEEAVRLTDDNDALVAHALKMLELWQSVDGYHGADDTQLPALAKLPALVALHAQQTDLSSVVESAIRVTNNNDNAVAFGQASANSIEAAIISGSAELSIDAAKQETTGLAAGFVEQALSSTDRTTPEVTADWGMACQLSIGFPSAIHNIARSASFTEAVRQNIYAGGDSCGRSILIGAVMGACHGVGTASGVPTDWLMQLRDSKQLLDYTERLLRMTA